ncbi:MAG: sigma-54-dependent Fis family transcriptional regulator, partial [Planctomycetaceae bacterium]|nr:sigma-54-dependent Fis family transcriptional regulator [Planctomycetaceae bacterium]
MPQLLVVDDEPLILETIRIAFADPDYEVLTAKNAESAVEIFQQNSPDVVLADIRLPDGSGLNLFERLHQLDARVPVILMTGHGSAGTAIDAMRAGAFEYILKPLDPDTLIPLVRSAAETSRMMRVPATLPSDAATVKGGDVLIGDCPAMQEVYRAIGRVAPQNVTVLIRGESGTGKEVVARAIYNYSQRSDRTFLAINCAAIPENLLESELFGHEKGAFTGADRRRIGKFEQCSEGTLFMDEVGDMTPLTQTKVLRALQNQEFERVGGNETIRTNVRLIAATNRNLEEMIEERTFRSDLFYRLNVYTIELPPLRDRGDDVRLLAQHFCAVFAKELDRNVTGLAPETLSLLQKYPWPGNVRELKNVLKRIMILDEPAELTPAHFPAHILAGHNPRSGSRQQAFGTATGLMPLSEVERLQILYTLEMTENNKSKAARLLGISRQTLREKLRLYDEAADADGDDPKA